MSNFSKRTSQPLRNNKYYYEDNIFFKCGYGLPNCTCYAWGRWFELMKKAPTLCTSNAENWFKYTKDGYKRGQTPKLGAICVWSKGKVENGSDGAGHVAVVEEIYSDGSILTSNSAYKSSLFYTKKFSKGYKLSGYKFLGFIYPPVEFTDKTKANEFKIGNTYTLRVNVKVRSGAGTDKTWKNRSDLTPDGKKNSLNQTKAVLKKGTRVTILDVESVGKDLWARIPSGWIAIVYDKEVYIK